MEKTSPIPLFDNRKINAKRHRALRSQNNDPDFLAKIAANTIRERLEIVQREFQQAADVYSLFDQMHQHLASLKTVAETRSFGGMNQTLNENTPKTDALPFKPQSLNLVTSVFGLHWINDLPGTLAQIRNALKPDGLFMAAIPGDRTLTELREVLIEAETQLTGNVSLRVDPFGEVRQLGGLLQRAGFTLPVVDTEVLTVRYSSLKALIDDLRAMGATSSLTQAPGKTDRNLFKEAELIYFDRYGDDDGKLRASFEIVYLLGWTPHESQQKPLKPGSADISLSKIL